MSIDDPGLSYRFDIGLKGLYVDALVLMADDLTKLPYALALSRKTRRTLIANLSFAFGLILLMVGFILTVGLPLPLAVVGHEGSTVLVSLNGLRLLGFRDR